MAHYGLLALYYLTFWSREEADSNLQEDYPLEEIETQELVLFVRKALHEIGRRKTAWADGACPQQVRITRELRVFIGEQELRVRPMAKTVLLLFLKHPEGISLKRIADYRPELVSFYGRVMRSQSRDLVELRVQRILDIFNNDLNVNIARVNAAVSALVNPSLRPLYQIQGGAGQRKKIALEHVWVHWEG